MTSLLKYPHKYLYVVSLIFHLFETTILSKSTESNEIACFDEYYSFLSTSLSPNFIFFKLIFIVSTDKNYLFFYFITFLFHPLLQYF